MSDNIEKGILPCSYQLEENTAYARLNGDIERYLGARHF